MTKASDVIPTKPLDEPTPVGETVLQCLERAMAVAAKHKPMDHSPADRLYAIMITEITKVIAFAGYFKM